MKFLLVCLIFVCIQLASCNENNKLKIGIKKRVENCDIKSRKQDLLHVKVNIKYLMLIYVCCINIYAPVRRNID